MAFISDSKFAVSWWDKPCFQEVQAGAGDCSRHQTEGRRRHRGASGHRGWDSHKVHQVAVVSFTWSICSLNHCSRFYYKYPGWYNPLNRFTKRSVGTDSGGYWMNDDFSKKRNKISIPWSMQLFSPMLRGKWLIFFFQLHFNTKMYIYIVFKYWRGWPSINIWKYKYFWI